MAPYWEQVWEWGRLYAGSTFVHDPLRNGVVRTLNWMGFHAAAMVAAAWFFWNRPRDRRLWQWVGWIAVAFAGVAAGMRFFPRYYFMLLPVVVLMAARGFVLLGRKRELVALLLLIPADALWPVVPGGAAATRMAGHRYGPRQPRRRRAGTAPGRRPAKRCSSGATGRNSSSTRGCRRALRFWIPSRSPGYRRTAT